MASFDPTTSRESWYPIPSLPGYQVSNRFRVRRSAPSRKSWTVYLEPLGRTVEVHPSTGRHKPVPLKQYDGYPSFHAKGRRFFLHRIIAEIAHGPCPDGLIVRHLDDDKGNLRPDNLAYGTQAQNVADAIRNGRHARCATYQ